MNIFENLSFSENKKRLLSRILDSVLEMTYFKPKGIFLPWILTRKWRTLLILFFIFHVCVTITFSSYYLNKGSVYSQDISGQKGV